MLNKGTPYLKNPYNPYKAPYSLYLYPSVLMMIGFNGYEPTEDQFERNKKISDRSLNVILCGDHEESSNKD